MRITAQEPKISKFVIRGHTSLVNP